MSGEFSNNVIYFQGKEIPFEQVYKKTYKLVLAKARSMLDDIDQAEDAVQELFLQLWERNKIEIKGASLEAYLVMSCHYKCLGLLSKQQREQKKLEGYVYSLSIQEIEMPSILADSSFNDKLKILEMGKQTLSHNQQEVIRKCYEEDKSHKEAAAEMNIKPNTLKSHLERSLQKFKSFFHEKCGTSL